MSTPKRALITGITGQDGSYLSELLLAKASHVLPALLRRIHEAKQSGASEVVIWGTGTPRREFLHVDDLAEACVFVMRNYDEPGILNVGVGQDVSIRELAAMIKDVVGFAGALPFDPTRPDGTPRKLLDVSRLHALGWRAKTPLRRGIEETYAWFKTASIAPMQPLGHRI
jgi:GDP-L-fucose synthase